MKFKGLIAGTALVLAACATSEPEPLTISGVNVQTDLASMQSRQAVDYWQSLSGDLETAIAAEFAGALDPAGKTINVDVDELSLTETFSAGESIDDARLSGRVTLVNADGTDDAVYTVTASSSDAVPFLPDASGTTSISATSEVYYGAIVRAFARGTATTLRAGT